MKKLLIFLTSLILISCNTKKADYFDTNYENVFQAALKQDKMIFIDFSTVWCGPCQYFEKKIVPDSLFMTFMNKNFCTIKIDAELEYNKAIVTKFKISGYPTFIITSSNGNEIGRIDGLRENTPEKFMELIKKILKGKEQIELLLKEYTENPDSLDLFRKLVRDKFLTNNLYKNAKELSIQAIKVSHNEDLKKEAKFYTAYASIKDSEQLSPKEMITFVNEKNNDKEFIEYGLGELFYFYRSSGNLDRIRYYLNKLINLNSQSHLGYVRDYAKILYEKNIDIDLADKLTKEYSETDGNSADHWTPFLKAHSLARHGDFEKGIEVFDNWMSRYSKPENFKEDYWHYKFYIDLFLFYKQGSKRAIEYAEKFAVSNPSKDNKQQLAELYYLNGNKSMAIEQLNEIKSMTDDPKSKNKINELIKKYSEEK